MSNHPESGESLHRRVEAHRSALSALVSETALTPSASAQPVLRADVLVSATMDEWSDGRDHRAYDWCSEPSETTEETTASDSLSDPAEEAVAGEDSTSADTETRD
ncbi:hypothetical protein [Streptomyces sp. NPDC051636]|uniref:hypothetical protein n=1 Tax=Streptomyces sp. NPDC051636 TaxID=3365663 RepID=UPI0037945EC0